MTKTMTAADLNEALAAMSSRDAGTAETAWKMVVSHIGELAAQAARVPGLEARIHELDAENGVRLARLKRAESERDAAQAELSAATVYLDRVSDKGQHSLRVAAVIGEVENLRERVATLERAQAELRKAFDLEQGIAQRALDARDTAEARVRELQTQVAGHLQAEEYVRPALRAAVAYACIAPATGSREHLRAEAHRTALNVLARFALVPGADERANQDDAPLASQPPPAPAQGEKCKGCDGKGYEEDVDDDCKGHRFACTSCKGTGKTPAPTPPPGLREAVGRILRAWEQSKEMGKPVELSLGTVESIRAAYDATGGETLDKARVVEVIRDLAQQRMDRPSLFQTGWVDALSEVATGLGLTLDTPPSGPGGGEEVTGAGPVVLTPAEFDAAMDLVDSSGEPARITPTPTPEVPPLKPEADACGACNGPLESSRTAVCETCAPEREWFAQAAAVEAVMSPAQPTTPTVVWEGTADGNPVRVVAGGVLQYRGSPTVWDDMGGTTPLEEVLARALADAKREVQELEQEVALKQTALNDKSRDYRDARKAAESMRERAAKRLEQHATHGRHTDDVQAILRELAADTRALPLE